ncbi:MAG: ATP-dependent helicase [Candidatus Limnocylindrales bacterium]
MTASRALDQPLAGMRPLGRDVGGAPGGAPVALATVAAVLRGLDVAQRRAVTHRDGPLIVTAGPGTGKTRVLTRRIAWLIATKRARPSEILALTFTEKAAAELQGRVDELVPYGFADTAIETFHAFGDRLARDHALELQLPLEPRVLSRAATVGFLRAHLFELGLEGDRPLGDPARVAASLADLFSRAKDHGITPTAYEAHAAALIRAARDGLAAAADDLERDGWRARLEAAEHHARLARAYATYQRLLTEAAAIDFGDQVGLAVRLLEEQASVRRALRARYRHVLVDEFQDTNPAQLRLLELLVGPSGNLTAVGDDDQAIYGFRGAVRGVARDPVAAWPGAAAIRLRRNYRSRRTILSAAARLIAHNVEGAPAGAGAGGLVAHRRARPHPVICHGFPTAEAEATWIASALSQRATGGRPLRGMAVLVRSNRDGRPILRALDAAGLASRFSGDGGLLSRPEVRELLGFLRTVADPTSTLDLYALATAEPYRLGGTDLTVLLEMARRRHRPLWEVFEELLAQPGVARLQPMTWTTVERLVGDVRAACALAHERPATEVLYDHLRRSGRLARLAAEPDGDAAVASVARFFGLVRDQAGVLPDERLAFLVPQLDLLTDDRDDTEAREGPLDERDAVAVLTVHKAKGLEFPVVVVAGLADGRFPVRGRAAPLALPEDLVGGGGRVDGPAAEERRLAYVAMTRARDELILTWAERGTGSRVYRPSPFLAEALDQPIPHPEPVPAGLGVPVAIAACGPGLPGPVPPTALTAPRELSFSQLDSYLACPRQYRYRYVVGLPTPPHHALVFGAALHAAVAAFHMSELRGRPLDEPTLLEAFAHHWRSEGFLSRSHEEARFAAGQAALRRFRDERLASGAPPPTGVETSFSVTIGPDRLRGRYDRVDETAGGAIITDYKSSEVADPRRAHDRARDSLQLALYALAYEAASGRPPTALRLHFLPSGLVGTVAPDAGRLGRARERLAVAAAGIREGRFEGTPDVVTCGGCPFREICPVSAA